MSLPETKVFRNHRHYCRKMNSLKFSKEILSLPIGEHLSLKDIKNICNKIKIFLMVKFLRISSIYPSFIKKIEKKIGKKILMKKF